MFFEYASFTSYFWAIIFLTRIRFLPGVSVAILWQFNMEQYIQKANSKTNQYSKKIVQLMTFQSYTSHTEKIFIDQILNLSKLNIQVFLCSDIII